MLVNGINKTIFATADDELRPVMNGIYINFSPSIAHLRRYRRPQAGEV